MTISPGCFEQSARAAIRALRELETTAIMLETYAPDLYPIAPEHDGKIHFGRALMEAAAEAIRTAWADAIREVEGQSIIDVAMSDFHNGLRVMLNIEWDEFQAAGVLLEPRDWEDWQADPYRFFIKADDETASKIWVVMSPRINHRIVSADKAPT